MGRATQPVLTHGFSFAFLLVHHFFAAGPLQMSVNARRHRLNMCLGGLVGYDVIAHATSLLHTQKVASSSLASSTFFFLPHPPMPLRRPTPFLDVLCVRNFKKSCSPAPKPLQSARGGFWLQRTKKKNPGKVLSKGVPSLGTSYDALPTELYPLEDWR